MRCMPDELGPPPTGRAKFIAESADPLRRVQAGSCKECQTLHRTRYRVTQDANV